MELFYEKYKNIYLIFINEYRKYKVEEAFMDFSTFKKNIQVNEYILHKCTDPKKGKRVFIYLFKEQSKYVKNTIMFKRLIDRLPNNELIDVIIITKQLLNIYINKAIINYNNIRIFNYKHANFSMELSKGPLCSKHHILSDDEVKLLCDKQLLCHPLMLPSISINDPQNIWVGGELGNVLKIDALSEITGKTIRYRIVSPDTGKITYKDDKDDKDESNKVNIKNKVADEVDDDDNSDDESYNNIDNKNKDHKKNKTNKDNDDEDKNGED